MSPEQAAGSKDLTPASDLYSLGIVAFELLTGELPYKTGARLAIEIAHRTVPALFPKIGTVEIPEALQHVVLKCLKIDPAKRYRTARELYEALPPFDEPKEEQ
jgi:serine/threonine-protein kinase